MSERSGPNGLAPRASAANATNESGGEAETQLNQAGLTNTGASGAVWGARADVSQRSAAIPNSSSSSLMVGRRNFFKTIRPGIMPMEKSC